MKKVKSKYTIIDTYTGDRIMFVATESRAKKICSLYDSFDYYESNLFDKTQLNDKHEKKGE